MISVVGKTLDENSDRELLELKVLSSQQLVIAMLSQQVAVYATPSHPLDEENWEEAALGGFGVAAECLRKLNSRLIHNSGYILDVANLFDEASSATGCIFMAGLSAGPSFTSAGKALGLHVWKNSNLLLDVSSKQ
eukprot:gene39364-51876_t